MHVHLTGRLAIIGVTMRARPRAVHYYKESRIDTDVNSMDEARC